MSVGVFVAVSVGVSVAVFVGVSVGVSVGDDVGVNQYLIYQLNDCWAVGGRFEWWKRDGASAYEATAGVNWRPHPNFVLRPEIRYNWGPGLAANLGLPENSTIFGIL